MLNLLVLPLRHWALVVSPLYFAASNSSPTQGLLCLRFLFRWSWCSLVRFLLVTLLYHCAFSLLCLSIQRRVLFFEYSLSFFLFFLIILVKSLVSNRTTEDNWWPIFWFMFNTDQNQFLKIMVSRPTLFDVTFFNLCMSTGSMLGLQYVCTLSWG